MNANWKWNSISYSPFKRKFLLTIQNHGIDSWQKNLIKEENVFLKLGMKSNYFFQAQNSCFTIHNCGIDSNSEKQIAEKKL